MSNSFFDFKQFSIRQDKSAFKVGTDGVLLGACADLAEVTRILDIGSGTGLIAIMLAQRSNANIIAIEPEVLSFQQAGKNVMNCKWNDRIEVLNLGLNEFSAAFSEKFDLIISNPPFFRDSLKNPDREKSAARHDDSLKSNDILLNTVKLLNPEGNLQLILPYTQGTLFIAEAIQFSLYCNRIIKIKPVPSGKIIRLILMFERIKKPLLEKFLTIETGTRHRYTEEYKEVTKDFYLKF